MSSSKCRVCESRQPDPASHSTCNDCAEYGTWLNAVRYRSTEEVTGKISLQDLADKLNRGAVPIQLKVFASEIARPKKNPHGHFPSAYYPQVISAVADDQGVLFTVRNHQGNTWSLWRPFRMGAKLLIGGALVELDTPDTGGTQ